MDEEDLIEQELIKEELSLRIEFSKKGAKSSRVNLTKPGSKNFTK